MANRKNPAAVALGRRGGTAGTAAQNAARAKNAQHAGRPGRVCRDCGEPVTGGHADRALDESCGPLRHGFKWQRAGKRTPAPLSRASKDRLVLDEIARVMKESGQRSPAVAELVRATGRDVGKG